MKKYKLINLKRFFSFVFIVGFIIIYISCIFHIKETTENKINKNFEVSKELETSIIVETNKEIKEELITEPIETTTTTTTIEEPELTSLGSFKVTAYCCCQKCCGKAPTHSAYGLTASGTKATEGRTVAVDPDIIPLGTTVYLNNIPYIAEDTGSAIKGNKIDLFINDHQRAKVFGVQEMEVKI